MRTSSGTFLRRGRDKIIRNIEQRIADFTFIPVGMTWILQGLMLAFTFQIRDNVCGSDPSVQLCSLTSPMYSNDFIGHGSPNYEFVFVYTKFQPFFCWKLIKQQH